MRSRILCISGHPEDVRQVSEMLSSLPVVLDHAESLQQARAQLQRQEYEVVFTDSSLVDGNWLDVLHLVRDTPAQMKVIVTDPHADARFWSEALNLGAYDLLAQPFYEPEVRRIFHNACTRDTRAMAAV
ncbi:MAG: response regulator [Acidobacteriia bacterium]|nr:response regulator [Terriglobia bacterium]